MAFGEPADARGRRDISELTADQKNKSGQPSPKAKRKATRTTRPAADTGRKAAKTKRKAAKKSPRRTGAARKAAGKK